MITEYRNKQYYLPFMETVETIGFLKENSKLPGFECGPGELIVEISKSLIGFPSRFCFVDRRMTSIDGVFSCNELVLFVLKETQKYFPDLIIPEVYYVNEMWDSLGISIDEKYAKPGDMVFYSHNREAPKHVGIFFGTSEKGYRYMIDSEGETGGHVVLSQISKNYRNKKLVNNPLYENGLMGYKRITMKTRNSRWPQTPIK